MIKKVKRGERNCDVIAGIPCLKLTIKKPKITSNQLFCTNYLGCNDEICKKRKKIFQFKSD